MRIFGLPLLPFVIAIMTSACGGDDSSGFSAPPALEDPFVMTFGAQQRSFSLDPGQSSQVVCAPKPGLGEFEYNASFPSDIDGQSSLKFILKEYAESKESWDVEYLPGGPGHTVEVGFANQTYRYTFFQSLRPDTNEILNSRCKVGLQSEEREGKTHFAGSMHCTMLWADFSSKDYAIDKLNNYIDIIARFECDY